MSTTITVVTIQPAQGSTVGEYDVHRPLPYPWHIDADGEVLRQEFWCGAPKRLAGFQQDVNVQKVNLFAVDWLNDLDNVDQVVGMFPVFIDADGAMWNSTRPIKSVYVSQEASA